MKAALYKLQCLTNLHVGNGDTGYSVIGNEVEKDVVLNMPIIHASGMKGSLRAYLKYRNSKMLDLWFGSDIQVAQKDQTKSKPGMLRFLSANLLAMPVRVSSGTSAYVMVTTKKILTRYCRLCKKFGFRINLTEQDFKNIEDDKDYWLKEPVFVEGHEIHHALSEKCALNEFLWQQFPDEAVVILSDAYMRELDLPVVARNQLNDGTSINLWYEEVVPHESIFYTIIFAPEGDMEKF